MKLIHLTLLLVCFILTVRNTNTAATDTAVSRSARRFNIPWLGIGQTCTGCPPHFCDDDPAIIHGYCCGCAKFYDVLPVPCPGFMQCPLDGSELCRDYEYMMHCCCS